MTIYPPPMHALLDQLAAAESQIRPAVFLGMLALMSLAESLFPRRRRSLGRGSRWLANLGLVVVDTVALRLAIPVLAVAMAVIAAERGWGLFNVLDLPFWLEAVAAFLVLDCAIWAQHVATHKVPVLWAFHKIHHADRDLDASSGLRFHPVEILFSMGVKIGLVLAIGPAAGVVVLFELVLNAAAIFNHANLRLPLPVDRALRTVIVTPDFHRPHHSTIRSETDSNYGFFLSVWDRLFRTYTKEPQGGHDDMTLGLDEYQTQAPASLFWCLIEPFRFARKPETTA